MDASEVFEQFRKDIYPDVEFGTLEDRLVEFEAFYTDVIKIVQKDKTFFDTERIVFGQNLSALSDEEKEKVWSPLLLCIVASFLNGDIKAKASKLIDIVRSMWNGSGQENEELSKILNDEKSEGYLKEIYDYVMETRLAKIFMKMVEEFDVSDLEKEIESIDQVMEMMKNPENPIMKKFVDRVKGMIEEKIKRGELSQQLITSEIEGIKAKVMSLFGNVFNDALGGRRADVPAQVLISNAPEARRQRMLARLQRKVREKNSQ